MLATDFSQPLQDLRCFNLSPDCGTLYGEDGWIVNGMDSRRKSLLPKFKMPSLGSFFGWGRYPGSEVEQKKKDTSKDPLTELISLQRAGGEFRWGAAFKRALGKEEKAVRRAMPKGCPGGFGCWLAALAVAVLKRDFADQRDSWDIVAEKAQGYIRKCEAAAAAAATTTAAAAVGEGKVALVEEAKKWLASQ